MIKSAFRLQIEYLQASISTLQSGIEGEKVAIHGGGKVRIYKVGGCNKHGGW